MLFAYYWHRASSGGSQPGAHPVTSTVEGRERPRLAGKETGPGQQPWASQGQVWVSAGALPEDSFSWLTFLATRYISLDMKLYTKL